MYMYMYMYSSMCMCICICICTCICHLVRVAFSGEEDLGEAVLELVDDAQQVDLMEEHLVGGGQIEGESDGLPVAPSKGHSRRCCRVKEDHAGDICASQAQDGK